MHDLAYYVSLNYMHDLIYMNPRIFFNTEHYPVEYNTDLCFLQCEEKILFQIQTFYVRGHYYNGQMPLFYNISLSKNEMANYDIPEKTYPSEVD